MKHSDYKVVVYDETSKKRIFDMIGNNKQIKEGLQEVFKFKIN